MGGGCELGWVGGEEKRNSWVKVGGFSWVGVGLAVTGNKWIRVGKKRGRGNRGIRVGKGQEQSEIRNEV